MLKADKLNDLNGSPAFGVSKYADRTDEGFYMEWITVQETIFLTFSLLIFI